MAGLFDQIVGDLYSERSEEFIVRVSKPKLFEHLLGSQILRMMSADGAFAPIVLKAKSITARAASGASPRPQNFGRKWNPNSGIPSSSRYGLSPQHPTCSD